MLEPTMDDAEKCCTRCNKAYKSLSQHLRRHPECASKPAVVVAEAEIGILPQPTPGMLTASQGMLQDEVARDLLDFRYKHGMSEPDVANIKEAARRWMDEFASYAALQLLSGDLIVPGARLEDLKAALSVKLFDGLATTHQEFTAAKRNLPVLEPRVVYPDGDSKGEPIVSFDQAELYFRRLRSDAAFRKKILAKSAELKSGDAYQTMPEELNDILDGAVARWHPHIHRPATPEEEHDVRTVQLEQVDDLELCGVLGTARGKHKQCGCQVACLSLPAEERFAPENIMLPVLARANVYRKHGMARVLAGVDKSGKQHNESSHAADMRSLAEGVWGQIPDDVRGGMMWIRLKVYTLTISADDPAKKSLTPFVESCAAHRNCNLCSFHSKALAAFRPLSFLCAPCGPPEAPEEPAAKRARPAFWLAAPKLRDASELHALLQSLRGADDAKAVKRAYEDHGINKLYYALEYYPHLDILELPFDALHLFPDGLLRSEGAWLFYVLAKMGLDLKAVDARVREYRDLPRDVRIPPLHAKLTSGTKGGCPKSSAVLRMTGSQVMHFALHRCAVVTGARACMHATRAACRMAVCTSPSRSRACAARALSSGCVCAASASSTRCSRTRCDAPRRG